MAENSLDNFCDGISQHVQEEIDSIISAAEEKSQRLKKKAEKQSKEAVDKIISSAKDRCDKIRATNKSENVSVLIKEELKLQGKVRKHIFSEIEQRINVLREDKDKYVELLLSLTVEALLLFKEKEVNLIVNESDKSIIDSDFIKKAQELSATDGVFVKIKISEKTHNSCGVILEAGNVLWENTIERRLELFSEDIDSIIINEVFEKMRG